MVGIGNVACPFCGDGIRASFQSSPGVASIVIDKRDLWTRHGLCLTRPTNGGERVSA